MRGTPKTAGWDEVGVIVLGIVGLVILPVVAIYRRIHREPPLVTRLWRGIFRAGTEDRR